MQTERIDIAKARKMLEGTTKGEWVANVFNDGDLHTTTEDDYSDLLMTRKYEHDAYFEDEANARWIAHAHNHYAALLDELEGARAELLEYRRIAADVWGGIQTAQTKRNGDVYFTVTTNKAVLDKLNQNITERREWMPEFTQQEGRT